MSYLKLLKQIKANNIPPILLVYGMESFFIQKITGALKDSLVDETGENLSIYDLEETPIEEVVSDVETYPFFGEKKVIIANNPAFLKARSPKLPFEHDLKALEKYIQQPVDYSVLVLVAPYEKLDNRKKITKELNKKVAVAACNPIMEKEMEMWINHLSKELHMEIDTDAIDVFKSSLSVNLNHLENELIKVATYVGEGGVVTKDIAENLTAYTTENSALKLVDAVIERNLSQAFSIYKDLQKLNEQETGLIGLLVYQFRMILRVKLLKEKGYTPVQIRKQVDAHPYVIQIAYEREKRFQKERLGTIINHFAHTDAQIKQGKMDKELAFELLLYELVKS